MTSTQTTVKTKTEKKQKSSMIDAIGADRERILLCGMPGSGKSYSLLALCDLIGLHTPDAKIFLLDADRGIGKINKTEWPMVNNIHTYKMARTWEDVESFIDEVEKEQTPQDWVLIDMLGRFWEMAQSLEVGVVHGVTTGSAMMAARKRAVEASQLNAPGSLPQPDWTVIKRFHNDEFIEKISTRWDCHLVATTSLNRLDQRDDAMLQEIFASHGFRPDGEKYNVHRFDTVMFVMNNGKHIFQTIKDRGRKLIPKTEYGHNLWESYAAVLRDNKYSMAGGSFE